MALQSKEYWQAHGSWISKLADWQLWAGVTFRKDTTQKVAFEQFTQYIFRLSRECFKQHIYVAWAWDEKAPERPHYHFLLGGVWGESLYLESDIVRSAWPHGITSARRYLTGGGAAYYMVKNHREWDVNVACPRNGRCRRRNCEHAPSTWPSFSAIGE